MTIRMLSGQVSPGADTVEDLATVPADRIVRGPIVTVSNTDTANHTFSIIVAPGGDATTSKMYVVTDSPIARQGKVDVVIPQTLQAGDVIRVKTDADELMNFFIQQLATTK